MSMLTHFAAVPERAAADQSLTARELRVLLAICRVVNRETGVATISQRRIAQRANLARQKVSAATAALVRKGYIARYDGKAKRNGQRPVAKYRIVYEPGTPAGDTAAAPGGDTAPGTAEGDTGRASTEVTASNVAPQSVLSDQPSPEQCDGLDPTEFLNKIVDEIAEKKRQRDRGG